MLLYIDPGTGSMLFSVLIGIVAAGFYLLRGLFIKAKFIFSGGKAAVDVQKHAIVIFSDSKRYWNVFGPICNEFEKRKEPVEYWTASEDDPALKENYQYVKCSYIGSGNKAFAKLNMMKAVIVLSTTPGLDVLQWKRSKDVDFYVHILHAVGSAAGYRMFGIDYFDALLLSGEFQKDEVRKLEELRHLPEKEIVMVGQPYLDALLERKKNSTNKINNTVKVLLAPSWGPSSILCRYGEEMLDALQKTGYDIVVRPHPQSFTADKEILDELMKKYKENDHFHWNRDTDNFEVLDTSDIMITDFSGVIYDFTLVFNKPIIYADTSFDHAPYDSAWLEDTLWKFQIIPKLGKKLTQEDFPRLRDVIMEVINSSEYEAGRQQAREEAWMYPGEATMRTVDYLIKKREQLVNK